MDRWVPPACSGLVTSCRGRRARVPAARSEASYGAVAVHQPERLYMATNQLIAILLGWNHLVRDTGRTGRPAGPPSIAPPLAMFESVDTHSSLWRMEGRFGRLASPMNGFLAPTAGPGCGVDGAIGPAGRRGSADVCTRTGWGELRSAVMLNFEFFCPQMVAPTLRVTPAAVRNKRRPGSTEPARR